MESYFTDAQTYPSTTSTPASYGYTAQTSTAAGKVTVGTTDIKLSKNNVPALVQTGTKGFCLSMQNSGVGTSANWWYDSLKGGLNSTGCSAAGDYT
jgi:hypothetical protein